MTDLTVRARHVIARESDVVRTQLHRNHIRYHQGTAEFLDPHTVFADSEVAEALNFHLRDLSMSFRFNETVESVKLTDHGTLTTLASGKRIPAEVVM